MRFLQPVPRNSASVRVLYTHNYRSSGNQDELVRPCIGACRRNQDSTGRVETRRYQPEQEQSSVEENTKTQTRISQDQRYRVDPIYDSKQSTPKGYAMNAQFGGSSFSAETSNGQRQNQFAVKGGGNSGVNFSGNYGNGQLSVGGQTGQNPGYSSPRPDQFAIKGGSNSGVNFSGNYGNGRVSAEGNRGEYATSYTQRQDQFSVKGGSPNGERFGEVKGSPTGNYEMKAQFGGSSFSAENSGVKGGRNNFGVNYSGNFRNDRVSVESQSGDKKYADKFEPTEKDGEAAVYFNIPTDSPATLDGGYR